MPEGVQEASSQTHINGITLVTYCQEKSRGGRRADLRQDRSARDAQRHLFMNQARKGRPPPKSQMKEIKANSKAFVSGLRGDPPATPSSNQPVILKASRLCLGFECSFRIGVPPET